MGNWTGKAIFGPRRELAHALAVREELKHPSVYFLLAAAPDNPALTQVYIGEAEDFAARVASHEKNKEWWEFFVVFGSKDANLTKAHIRFLERWFYDRAAAPKGRLRVMNENTPHGAKLPEADIAEMDVYGKNALFLLGALGYRLFEGPAITVQATKTGKSRPSGSAEFHLIITRDHRWSDGSPAVGRLRVDAGGYLLLAGSAIRTGAMDSFKAQGASYWNLSKKLVDNPDIVHRVTEDLGRLRVDVPFNSPSAAAAVVRARTTNGRTDWKEVTPLRPRM